eukprot:COSAG02_NODE_24305_length_692_cov_1.175727_2_plen_49_part_01
MDVRCAGRTGVPRWHTTVRNLYNDSSSHEHLQAEVEVVQEEEEEEVVVV